MKTYHITKDGDQWKSTAEGGQRASVVGDNKQEVISRMAEIGKNSSESVSVRIHKENGQFQEERTYPRSADPKTSKG